MADTQASSPIRSLLERIPLFSRLADRQLATLSRQFAMTRVKAGERIFRLVQELDYATFETIAQRLARCLLAAAEHAGIRTDGGV